MTPPVLSTLRITLAALVVAASFAGGWVARDWRAAKTDLKATQTAVKDTAAENTRRRAIGAQHARAQHAIENFYDGMPPWWPRVVAERPGLADCELGPVGLREWNRWNEGPAGD